MTTKKERLRKRSRTLLGSLASTAVVGVLLLGGGLTSAQAGEIPCNPGSSNTAEAPTNKDMSTPFDQHNGYCIKNTTNNTLFLATNLKSKGVQTYKNGWGDEPPKEIKPHTFAYFEVTFRWTPDDSFLAYEAQNPQGKTVGTVKFEAKVDWLPGRSFGDYVEGQKTQPDFIDKSTCSVSSSTVGKCVPTKSQGRGYQTVFEYDGNA